jgi:hypothetical protein
MWVLLCLLAGLTGCGGSETSMISGTVYTTLDATYITRQNSTTPVAAYVPVTFGYYDSSGTVFTPITSTKTDSNGHYSLPVSGIKLNPSYCVVAGFANETQMVAIVAGNIVDIRPTTTAACDMLYTVARGMQIPVDNLSSADVARFLTSAYSVGILVEDGNISNNTVNSCVLAIYNNSTVRSRLRMVLPKVASIMTPICVMPEDVIVGTTERVVIVGDNFLPTPTISDSSNSNQLSAKVVDAIDGQLALDVTVSQTAKSGYHTIVLQRGTNEYVPVMLYVKNPSAEPVISYLSPNSGLQRIDRNTSYMVTITGSGFNASNLSVSGELLQISSIQVVSATTIKALITIPHDIVPGAYIIRVHTNEGSSQSAVFTVIPPEPIEE